MNEETETTNASQKARTVENKENDIERIKFDGEEEIINSKVQKAKESVERRRKRGKKNEGYIDEAESKVNKEKENVLKNRELPQAQIIDSEDRFEDEDVILLLDSILDNIERDKNVLNNEEKLSQWIYESEYLVREKKGESKVEAIKIRRRLIALWANCILEEIGVGKDKREKKIDDLLQSLSDKNSSLSLNTLKKIFEGKARFSTTISYPEMMEIAEALTDPSKDQHKAFIDTIRTIINLKKAGSLSDQVVVLSRELARLNGEIYENPLLQNIRTWFLEKLGKESSSVEPQKSRKTDAQKFIEESIETARKQREKEIMEILERRAGEDPQKKNDEVENFVKRCIFDTTEAIQRSNSNRILDLLNEIKEKKEEEGLDPIEIGLYQQLETYLLDQLFILQSKRRLGSEYRRVLSDEEMQDLSHITSPDVVYELLKGGDQAFELYRKKCIFLYSRILSKADDHPEEPFEQAIDPMYEKPILSQITYGIRLVEQRAQEDEIKGKGRVINGELLSNRLRQLRKELESGRFIRSFSHNMAYIVSKRGTLKEIAGYAELMKSADLDVVFSNPLIVEAASIFEEKITQYLNNNNWRTIPDMLQSVIQYGGSKIDAEVTNMLREMHQEEIKNRIIQDWEIESAYRVAKGIQMGATAVLFDLFGESDPPVAESGEKGAFASYPGEKILGIWNIRHHFLRFAQPNELTDLVYAIIDEHGRLSGWSHKKLKETKEKFLKARGSDKYKILEEIGGKPFIEISNFFKIGGVFSRGGWRTDLATYHLLESISAEERRQKNLPSIDIPAGAKKDLRAVDWEKSWENFMRAGTYVAYYWAEQRAQYETCALYGVGSPKELSDKQKKKAKELEKKYKIDALRHLKRVDPLYFAFREKEEMHLESYFKRSLRGKALIAVYQALGFPVPDKLPNPNNLSENDREVLKVEDAVVLVKNHALQKAWERFDSQKEKGDIDAQTVWLSDRDFLIQEEDFDEVISHENIKKAAKEYFRVLSQELVKKKDGVSWEEWFHKRGFYYSIGTTDVDFRQIRFTEAGPSIIGRVWGDAAGFEEAFGKLQGISSVLNKVNALGYLGNRNDALNTIVEFIENIVFPIEMVHGTSAAEERARFLATLCVRYFQKDWTARILPDPLQKIVEAFGVKINRARELHGRRTWSMTEDDIGELINRLRARRLISEKDEGILRETLGARYWQVYGIDVIRSSILTLIIILMIQAILESLKQEE